MYSFKLVSLNKQFQYFSFFFSIIFVFCFNIIFSNTFPTSFACTLWQSLAAISAATFLEMSRSRSLSKAGATSTASRVRPPTREENSPEMPAKRVFFYIFFFNFCYHCELFFLILFFHQRGEEPGDAWAEGFFLNYIFF